MNDKLEMIYRRRSVRSYADTPLTGEEIGILQKAATLSPNAMNEQPWFFVIIENQEIIHEIEALHEPSGNCYGAPVLIAAFAKKDAIAPLMDTSIALANIIYAAEAMDLSSCIIYFVKNVFNNPSYAKLKEAMGVPEGYICVSGVVIGHGLEEKQIAEGRKEDIFSVII